MNKEEDLSSISSVDQAKDKTDEEKLKGEIKSWILDDNHPCIMAQTVFSMDNVDIKTYSGFGTEETALKMLADLKNYIDLYDFNSNDFYSFIATFPDKTHYTELEFEHLLWKQLELIHSLDDQPWDPAVSNDPENKDFSFSIAGKAFFVIGMHPNSKRIARQSPVPALAFNLHWQFEKLREMGTFKNIRNKIRRRDKKLQGTINPMVKNFGEGSEAPQYSGREVDESWKCPFHPRN